MEIVGRRLNKGSRNGVVKSYDSSRLLFEIGYDDGGESEHIDLTELMASFVDDEARVSNNKRPKAPNHDSGNLSTVDNFDKSAEFISNSNSIDLNLELNVEKLDKKSESFDLNMDLDDDVDTKNENVDVEGYTQKKENSVDENKTDNVVARVENSVVETKTDKVVAPEVVDNDDTSGKGRRGRKRRKVVTDSPQTPAGSSSVLRRSARRQAAMASIESIVKYDGGGNDVAMESPVISAVSEDRNTITNSGCDEACIVPTKLEFPPSTGNVNLDGLPVLDLFSVYAFLRSFSTTLFLSLFELGDFVGSIRNKSPNLLIDSIHLSLLRILRKHLEFLASENITSATNCLRDLNWDLLDLITWPMYMAEYLLTKPDFDLARLKLFKSDYYKQSEFVKVELLQYICDDVIEIEAISLELNRRIVGSVPNAIDPDLSTKSAGSKKRRARMGTSANSCMSEEVIDVVADWNSDECCLCKMDGNLICCDGCPAAYHSKCVGIATNLLPEGDWYCPECVVDKKNPEVNVAKSIRGADLLTVDPHGRLYYSSCGYLLVSDSCDGETTFRYYQMNDLTALINALNSFNGTYRATSNAITKHWRLYTKHYGEKGKFDSKYASLCVDPVLKIAIYSSKTRGAIERPLSHSAGSSELSEAVTGTKKSSKTRRCSSNGSSGVVGTHVDSSNNGHELSEETATRKGMSQQLGIGYLNLYSFARVASSVSGDWIRKPSDKTSQIPTKSLEELISVQMKAISKTSVDFCWSNIQNISVDAQKEKCGWCLACKYPTDDGNCLFFMNNPAHVESFTSELLGFDSKINRKDRLVDVMCHILYMEERLHGLLLGPWRNPQFPKIYHKSFVEASDIVPVKNLLLMLESNIWLRALSDEWLKHVDSVITVGSASHIVTKLRMNSRNVIERKRSTLGSESHSLKNAFSGLSLYWWRGGRLTRKLFNWKVLPRSLACKAARQGGGKKIDGILYPENSEFLKRSKALVWRASVESAVTAEQLALQIRELDANIKWEEIENTSHLAKMDKESIKSMRSFKKAIIRRKSSEGTSVKYLLDFGKRRFIPEPIVKHGSKIEESSSERKKYWVDEPYVPLFLLKPFEEKRITLKSNKMTLSSIPLSRRVMKPSKTDIFSYLLAKAEIPKNHRCGHCNKDVLVRDAISCQCCEGFFHKRHVRKTSGGTYTCHKCHVGDTMKTSAKKGKSNSRKTKKVLKNSKKVGKGKQLVHSQAKNKAFAVPLRRSDRTAKIVSLQSKKKPVQKKKKSGAKKKQLKYAVDKVEKPKGKRGRPRKIKKGSFQKKRKHAHTSYWLNGLLLSRNPDDERVTDFRAKNHIVSFEQTDSIADLPTCLLCDEPEFRSSLNYINCETCGEWYHADAFGLNNEYTAVVIGFECHKCRERAPPICPHVHSISFESKLAEHKNDEGGKFGDETSSEVLLEKTNTIEEWKDSPRQLNAETVPDSKQDPAKDVCDNIGDETSSEVLMTEKPDIIEGRKVSPRQLNAETNPDFKQDPAKDACGNFGDETSGELLMTEKTDTSEEQKASPRQLYAETFPDSKQDRANDVHNEPDSKDAHGEDTQNRSDLGQNGFLDKESLLTHKESGVAVAQNGSLREENSNTSPVD